MTWRDSAFRSLVQYYVALRLSAGAVAPMIASLPDTTPVPIVRRYLHANEALWHPLECVSVGETVGIITMARAKPDQSPRAYIGYN